MFKYDPLFYSAIHSSTAKQGTSSEDSDLTSTKVKSFASFESKRSRQRATLTIKRLCEILDKGHGKVKRK